MAIYHLSVKPISRSAGRSATGAASYRAGVKITDERTGQVFDYRKKQGVESADIVLPDGAPAWAADRAKLWNAAELAEKRKDACLAREFEVALPAELSPLQRRQLALDFAKDMAQREGCAVDVAIHAPGKGGDNRNHHAHILRTTRKVEANGLGAKLDTEKAGRKRADDLEAVRARWADLVNERLRQAGKEARVDHRSLEAQGIEREPTGHLGPSASGYERRTEKDSDKRIQQEQRATERLARANTLRELDWASRDAARDIADLAGDLTAALAARDTARQAQEQAERQVALQAQERQVKAVAAKAQADQEQAAQQAKPDPAAVAARAESELAAYLRGPGVTRRGMIEPIPPRQTLDGARAARQGGLSPAFSMAAEEQADWQQRGWLRERDLNADLTAQGRAVLDTYTARCDAQEAERAQQAKQQAQQEQAEQERRAEQAEQERKTRLDEQKQRAAAKDTATKAKAEQEQRDQEAAAKLDEATEHTPGDSIRALRRSADDWRDWRRLMLESAAYERDQAEAIAGLGKLERTPGGLRLDLWQQAGAVLDTGDRIRPQSHPPSDAEINAALRMARAKGWDQGRGIDLTGSSEFRERAARQAARMGIPVANDDLAEIVAHERARIEAERRPAPAQNAAPTTHSPATHPPAPDPAALEAQSHLGDDPWERQRRWNGLVARTQTPPKETGVPTDKDAALQAWMASRQQRGQQDAPTTCAQIARRIEHGWTSEGMAKSIQSDLDAQSDAITELERTGRRWVGGNRNAQEIAQLQAQQQHTLQQGKADFDLARDYEAVRPRFAAQEHAQRMQAYGRDVDLRQRIEPHALAILEADRQAQEQAKLERQRQAPQRKARDRGGPTLG